MKKSGVRSQARHTRDGHYITTRPPRWYEGGQRAEGAGGGGGGWAGLIQHFVFSSFFFVPQNSGTYTVVMRFCVDLCDHSSPSPPLLCLPSNVTLSISLALSFDRHTGLGGGRPHQEWQTLVWPPLSSWGLSRSSHISDLTLVLQWLPCQAPGNVGSALGLFGPVSTLWLGEIASLTVICNFYLSVSARAVVWAEPPLRCTSMLLGC